MKRTFFITGTDTGTGKTVLTALLAQFLRQRGVKVVALKPICSGRRDDARALHAALGGALTLDEINPWHFRAAIAPLFAASLEKKSVKLGAVLTHIRAMRSRFDVTLVEGAGGLLSPLGETFDSRDLIIGLRATPMIVAQNQLGAVNHILLTLAALPKKLRAKAKVILMFPAKPDSATASNTKLLERFFPQQKIFTLPWFGNKIDLPMALENLQVRQALQRLT